MIFVGFMVHDKMFNTIYEIYIFIYIYICVYIDNHIFLSLLNSIGRITTQRTETLSLSRTHTLQRLCKYLPVTQIICDFIAVIKCFNPNHIGVKYFLNILGGRWAYCAMYHFRALLCAYKIKKTIFEDDQYGFQHVCLKIYTLFGY